MQSNNSKSGKLTRLAIGAFRLLEGVVVGMAIMLVAGWLGGLAGLAARGSFLFEQAFGGATIGAVWAVLRITGFRYAVSTGVGALIGWEIGALCGTVLTNLGAATVGGCVGPLLQRIFQGASAARNEQTLSAKTRVLGTLSALVGVILGYNFGGVIASWLCIILAFGVPPWRLPRTIEQGGPLIFAAAVLGEVLGAVIGGRCLYLWVVRRLTARPAPDEAIREYEEWKRHHVPPVEEDKQI
jgi:hypothetical protein